MSIEAIDFGNDAGNPHDDAPLLRPIQRGNVWYLPFPDKNGFVRLHRYHAYARPYQVTLVTKSGGPLTKRISLGDDGAYHSDGSACVMSTGTASRTRLADAWELAELIGGLRPEQALTLGALDATHPDETSIVSKDQLSGQPNTIARTADAFVYRPGQPAFALLDFDTKGIPAAVQARIEAAGGFRAALLEVLPTIEGVHCVERRSTSAGLYRTDTGEKLPGSCGLHLYLAVKDGTDIERFLKVLHDRCWLTGFGWYMLGKAGQLLERSIVDRMVYGPERLVFEGAPIVVAPLKQDADSRKPVAHLGEPLDTVNDCRDLTIVETAEVERLRSAEARRLAPDQATARAAYIAARADELAVRMGISAERAGQIVGRQCDGVLYPSTVLPFTDRGLIEKTVGDVLADPMAYVGETLADPIEGVEYGRQTAKIMMGDDGWPFIHSFAHSRTFYRLRYDVSAVSAAIVSAQRDTVVGRFMDMAMHADLDEVETETLITEVARLSGGKTTVLKRQLKKSMTERDKAARVTSRHIGRRPTLEAPYPDDERLPIVKKLDEVLSASTADEPPMRDLGGNLTAIIDRSVPSLHELNADDANDDAGSTRLPAPEQPLMTRLNGMQAEELIERYVRFVRTSPSMGSRIVTLPSVFVEHYRCRPGDDALPVVRGVATLPIVLPNGELLSERGLDRQRQIVMRAPTQLLELIPACENCGREAAREAMRWLVDEWLCDVETDYAGKAVLISQAATVVERLVLDERPAFVITAGQRGGGKTTAANMIAVAATGKRASATAWSPSPEERRKALLAYLEMGLPLLTWDNIERGSELSCPAIEAALTTATYTDRRLGHTEAVTVSATTVLAFTGNNIVPVGDLASRALITQIEVDRPDPENREFKHPDPLGWTEANRGKILASIYTILLGNPQLDVRGIGEAQTRFKRWWKLVGSAIEHAAAAEEQVSFAEMFLANEGDDDAIDALSQLLVRLKERWPNGFTSGEVVACIPPEFASMADLIESDGRPRSDYDLDMRGMIETGTGHHFPRNGIDAVSMNAALRKVVGRPVRPAGGEIVKLTRETGGRTVFYKVV